MNKFFQPLKKATYITFLLLMTACTPPTQPKTAGSEPFVIDGNTITLHKNHILSIQTQLYQPSFDIAGIMLPAHQADIIAPNNGTIVDMAVFSGQLVKKGEKLATLLPITPFNNAIKASPAPITLTAPFDGRIHSIHTKPRAFSAKYEILMTVASDNEYKFVGQVPRFLKDDLKIGQPINLITQNQAQTEQALTGQLSDIQRQNDDDTPNNQLDNKLIVTANIPMPLHIKGFFETDERFKTGEPATGHIVADGLKVGVLVPEQALIGDVSSLTKPPHRNPLPLPASAWVIHQDHSLHHTAVSVIEYLPDVNRYLVAGIGDDGLLVIADLPDKADGLTVVVK